MNTKLILPMAVSLLVFGCEKPMDPECKGEPIADCNCYMLYDPVCGCDGVTYGNDCMAHCAGVKSWTPGECGQ
jgi:hypothetical protein